MLKHTGEFPVVRMLEGIGKLKKFIHLIRSRTRDLPARSIIPQQLRYRVSSKTVINKL
jgi:hypothetical protein